MTATMIDDSGSPAMLDTKDVVEMFKHCNLAVYAEARRTFYREVNLNPFKTYSPSVRHLIEWMFWDWFAFDCTISGIGITGNASEDLKIELEYGPGSGVSPFLAMAEFLHDDTGDIDDRAIRDLREIDDTNFASMFWIADANAAKGRVRVTDLIHGGSYELADPATAGKYDGANGGIIVNRIAYARGAWRSCAIPIYESRNPGGHDIGECLARDFRRNGYQPDFPGLVRFFYGRAKDTGLDWEDTLAARDDGTLDQLIRQACS